MEDSNLTPEDGVSASATEKIARVIVSTWPNKWMAMPYGDNGTVLVTDRSNDYGYSWMPAEKLRGATGPQGPVGPQGPAGAGGDLSNTTGIRIRTDRLRGEDPTDPKADDDTLSGNPANPANLGGRLIYSDATGDRASIGYGSDRLSFNFSGPERVGFDSAGNIHAQSFRVVLDSARDPGHSVFVEGRGRFVHGLNLDASGNNFASGSDHFHIFMNSGNGQAVNRLWQMMSKSNGTFDGVILGTPPPNMTAPDYAAAKVSLDTTGTSLDSFGRGTVVLRFSTYQPLPVNTRVYINMPLGLVGIPAATYFGVVTKAPSSSDLSAHVLLSRLAFNPAWRGLSTDTSWRLSLPVTIPGQVSLEGAAGGRFNRVRATFSSSHGLKPGQSIVLALDVPALGLAQNVYDGYVRELESPTTAVFVLGGSQQAEPVSTRGVFSDSSSFSVFSGTVDPSHQFVGSMTALQVIRNRDLSFPVRGGTVMPGTVTRFHIGGMSEAVGAFASAVGYGCSSFGAQSSAFGHNCSTDAPRSTALGYGAQARVPDTVAIGGTPILAASREDGSNPFQAYSAPRVAVCSEVVDLSAAASYRWNTPGGSMFLPDSFSVVVVESATPTGTAVIDGNKMVSKTNVGSRNRYVPATEDGTTNLSVSVTAPITSGTLKVRFIWEGLLMEWNTSKSEGSPDVPTRGLVVENLELRAFSEPTMMG